MKSLEARFTRTKRSHNFIDPASLVNGIGVDEEPQVVPLRYVPPATSPTAAEPSLPAAEILDGLRQDWLARASTPKP